MRQRLENPIFGFANSTVANASVSSTAGVSTSTDTQLKVMIAEFNTIKAQLIAIGLIQAS